jgi:hypothetical protein
MVEQEHLLFVQVVLELLYLLIHIEQHPNQILVQDEKRFHKLLLILFVHLHDHLKYPEPNHHRLIYENHDLDLKDQNEFMCR